MCELYIEHQTFFFFLPLFSKRFSHSNKKKKTLQQRERERENDDDDDDDDCGVNLSKATLRLWQRKGNERRRENVLAVLRMKMPEIGKTRRSLASKNAHT